MTRMKVGVVGLGEVTQVIHLPILQAQTDLFELTAICDISAEAKHDRAGRADWHNFNGTVEYTGFGGT